MPRPICPRRVGFNPSIIYFKPAGIPITELEEVILGKDELEAMRLKDLLGFSQEEAAKEMNISQPTFHRLVTMARQKIADAFVNGKAVRIEGGNILARDEFTQPCHWKRRWGCRAKVKTPVEGTETKKVLTGGQNMKIAITSQEGTLDGMIDERFGRAKRIIVYDVDTKEFKVVDNMQNMNAAQGAGIQTAQNVAETGAKAVVSGHLGPNAYRVLATAGIDAYTASGLTVQQAIDEFIAGKLVKLSSADVQGHW